MFINCVTQLREGGNQDKDRTQLTPPQLRGRKEPEYIYIYIYIYIYMIGEHHHWENRIREYQHKGKNFREIYALRKKG